MDEAILGVYLAGTNTRRIKGALAPLLRNGPLSKDAVSRLVGVQSGGVSRESLLVMRVCVEVPVEPFDDGFVQDLHVVMQSYVELVQVLLGLGRETAETFPGRQCWQNLLNSSEAAVEVSEQVARVRGRHGPGA